MPYQSRGHSHTNTVATPCCTSPPHPHLTRLFLCRLPMLIAGLSHALLLSCAPGAAPGESYHCRAPTWFRQYTAWCWYLMELLINWPTNYWMKSNAAHASLVGVTLSPHEAQRVPRHPLPVGRHVLQRRGRAQPAPSSVTQCNRRGRPHGVQQRCV